MSIIFATTTGVAWSKQVHNQSYVQESDVHLSINSRVLTGHYKGSVKKVLNSLGRLVHLTYTDSPHVLDETISGILEQVSLPRALGQMLANFNFLLEHDEDSGSIRIYFLGHRPNYSQVQRPLSVIPQEIAMDSEVSFPMFSSYDLDELTSEEEEQFDVAHQETVLSPELQEQFDVAHQETVLPPKLQEQCDVAYQETVLSPEIQEQFDVAHQETVLSPELQEQFNLVQDIK
jgi:hypothetical protein